MSDTQINKDALSEAVSKWLNCLTHVVLGRKSQTPIACKDGKLTASFDIPLSSISVSSLFTKSLKEAGFQVISHYIDTRGNIVTPEDTCQGIRVQATIADSPEVLQHFDAVLKAATHDVQVAAIAGGIAHANELQALANDYYIGNGKPATDSLRAALDKAVQQSPLQSTITLNALPVPAPARAGISSASVQGTIDASVQGTIDVDLGKPIGSLPAR